MYMIEEDKLIDKKKSDKNIQKCVNKKIIT